MFLKGKLHVFSLSQWKTPSERRRSQLSNKQTNKKTHQFFLAEFWPYSEGLKNANFSVAESGVPSDVRVAHLAFLGEIAKHIM